MDRKIHHAKVRDAGSKPFAGSNKTWGLSYCGPAVTKGSRTVLEMFAEVGEMGRWRLICSTFSILEVPTASLSRARVDPDRSHLPWAESLGVGAVDNTPGQ
jgi:hypothetical protein